MSKFTQLSCSLLAGALLVGCGGGAAGGSNGGGSASNTAQVSIDAMTSVPVINGSATQGTLYVHNYGNTAASGVSFNLGTATTKTKVKAVLAKVGLNFGGYEDVNGFVLINPERCGSIPAGGSCAVNFSTPSMSVGNLGNSLVKLSYNGSHGSATTSQVVNYKYVNLAALSGVNFTGSLNVTGVQGSTQHVVGYVYGGGASGTSYKNVNLNSTNATTRISNGFINGQEVVAGQVIAVEFAVAMQSNKTSAVNVTPSWGSSKLQASLLNSLNSGSPLTLSLTPTQSTVNLIFGNIPVLSAPTTSAAVVNVVNNGNADSSGGLTATATGGNASDLSIDYSNCSAKVLEANAANSCQITFSTASYTSGTTTVQYANGSGAVVGSQTVVWTNDQPFPAVYIAPSPTTISVGKGQSTASGSIVFTVTNVGKAPLTSVTYPVTNTSTATWTQDGSTCTTTIGALASCAISGHLTGTNDGTGSLYIKAQGSFNSVSYSFVALPLSYTVTANPSLEITPVSASMTLLANGVESQSQTFTVKNVGNDPAIFTGLALNDSSTNTVKPVIISGSGVGECTSSTTLNETVECTVIVKYGPAAASKAINESGVATLQVAYHGGTPDTSYTSQAPLNYNLVGNDSYVTESTTVSNLTGAGTSGSPYAGNANLNPMKITLTYSNPSVNYPMSKFNLNTNGLPYGLTVDPSSTCKTGSETMSLESNGASCTLVLALDRSVLASIGGSVVLDFTTPTATWTTPLGFYSQAGSQTYLTYAQPSVVFALSNNNASFESTVLSITGSNLDKGANPLPVSVAGVKNWLESSPVNPSAGCTVNPSTYAVSCNLTAGTNPANVTYIMPNYLQTGESASIPLLFSTTAYAYLNPSYTFINYVNSIIQLYITPIKTAHPTDVFNLEITSSQNSTFTVNLPAGFSSTSGSTFTCNTNPSCSKEITVAPTVIAGYYTISTSLGTSIVIPVAVVKNFAYIPSSVTSGLQVEICEFNDSGFSNCANANPAIGSQNAYGVTISAIGTYAYVATGAGVYKCAVNQTSKTLDSCSYQTSLGALNTRLGAISTNGQYFYINSRGDSTIRQCAISPVDGNLTDCAIAYSGLTASVERLVLDYNGNNLFVNTGEGTKSCSINSNSGSITLCQSSGFSSAATGINYNLENTKMYFTQVNNSSAISFCNYNNTTQLLSGCTNAFSVSSGLSGWITGISFSSNFAFVSTVSDVYSCPINNTTGMLSTCSAASSSSSTSAEGITVFN